MNQCWYLDWNATAPLQGDVLKWYIANLEQYSANPHSQHRLGREAMVAVENAREQIAELVKWNTKGVRFTSGATESNTWLCSSIKKHGTVIGSAVEHPAVGAWLDESIPVDSQGIISLDWLQKRLQGDDVSLVSVMAANNESGVLQPTQEIYEICQNANVLYHCDAAQVFNRIDWTPSADFLTLSGHKMGAPKGVGALLINQEVPPLFLGGAQERATRAGTLNAPAIITWGQVASQARPMSNQIQQKFEEALCTTSATIIAQGAKRLPNTTLALFDVPGDLIVMALDMKGIAVSTGSACSSGSSKDSFVLSAMGLQGKPVRFSWGHGSNIIDAIPEIIKTIKELEQTCVW